MDAAIKAEYMKLLVDFVPIDKTFEIGVYQALTMLEKVWRNNKISELLEIHWNTYSWVEAC